MTSAASKLPVFAFVKASYQIAWQHYPQYWRIIQGWLLLAVPVVFLIYWSAWPEFSRQVCSAAIPEMFRAYKNNYQEPMLPSNITVFITASVAVAWHRLILLQESVQRGLYLRCDDTVWVYLLYAITICVLGILPFMALSFAAMALAYIGHTEAAYYAAIVLGIIALSFFMFVCTRLWVMLPSRAVGMRHITLKDAWQRTRGSIWRLMAGTFLCAFPLSIVVLIITTVVDLAGMSVLCPGPLNWVLVNTVADFFTLLVIIPVALAYLSLSFRFFYGSDAETTTYAPS